MHNVHTSFFLTILVNIFICLLYCRYEEVDVVYEGSVPGVYEHWEDCFKQVNKYKGNNYKSYKSKAEAETRYLNYHQGQERKNHRMKSNFLVIPLLLIVFTILLYAIQ